FFSALNGLMQTANDVDVFEVDVPMDINTKDMMGNPLGPRLEIFPQPSSITNGDGSTASPGEVWGSDTLDPTGAPRIGSLDDTNYGDGDLLQKPGSGPAELAPRIKPGQTYYVFVKHSSMPAGTNDFYFLQAYTGALYANPLEKIDPMTMLDSNDTAMT